MGHINIKESLYMLTNEYKATNAELNTAVKNIRDDLEDILSELEKIDRDSMITYERIGQISHKANLIKDAASFMLGRIYRRENIKIKYDKRSKEADQYVSLR